jgi:outer membrane lipoprotein-sorting protein
MIMHRHFISGLVFGICLVALPQLALADEAGSQLAAKLRAKESGSTLVRIRMQAGNQILQVQIKSRVSAGAADVVYQILFPKERKGESVLLRRAGNKFNAASFTPPNTIKQVGPGEMNLALFGTELSYEDIIDSPFAWSQQAIVGTQDIDRFSCQILESKPGNGHVSSYASVKTWVDPRRMVPLQIEKYDSSGKVIRRINITRMLLDGGDSLPADLEVSGPRGSVTRITGSSIKRGVNYTDADFAPENLKELKAIPSE